MNWSNIAPAAATLFFIMDPLGNMPVFNAILERFDSKQRSIIVAREMLFALVILMTFLFTGTAILDFMGLTESSLSIAGGVLLFIIALRMIFPQPVKSSTEVVEDPFIVPLAMPMVAGPSTIAILLLLSSSQPEHIWTGARHCSFPGVLRQSF